MCEPMIYKSKILTNLKKLQSKGNLPLTLDGKLTRVVGLTLEAVGCNEPIGSRVAVAIENSEPVEAEVVGFDNDKSFLMCVGSIQGIAPGARIIPTNKSAVIPVSKNLLGRVINGAGVPLDKLGLLAFIFLEQCLSFLIEVLFLLF